MVRVNLLRFQNGTNPAGLSRGTLGVLTALTALTGGEEGDVANGCGPPFDAFAARVRQSG